MLLPYKEELHSYLLSQILMMRHVTAEQMSWTVSRRKTFLGLLKAAFHMSAISAFTVCVGCWMLAISFCMAVSDGWSTVHGTLAIHSLHFGIWIFSIFQAGRTPWRWGPQNHTSVNCETSLVVSPHRHDRSGEKVLGSDYILIFLTIYSKVIFSLQSNIPSGNLFLILCYQFREHWLQQQYRLKATWPI